MNPATVLIAGDDEPIRTAYLIAMHAKGYTVLEAENGTEGVRLAQEYRPDLILLDLMMPVLDGWSAAKALQENPATASIPRVAITALHLDASTRDKLAADFALVLPKPIALLDLYAAMEALLRGRTGPP